jgi:hypothetical protein
MMRKLFLIFGMIFLVLKAEEDIYEDYEDVRDFNELIYQIGMSLSYQAKITDYATAKDAFLNVYNKVDQVTQIFNLFFEANYELAELNITDIDQLIDYVLSCNQEIIAAGVLCLSKYQKLFSIFIAMHPYNNSFEIWEKDMDYILSLKEGQMPKEKNYINFWHATYDLMQSQKDFEILLEKLE